MILVTGGLGTIGSHTALALTDAGEAVLVTAHRRADMPDFLDDRVVKERVDIADRDALLALGERHDIQGIVHLAGSVPGSDPVEFFRIELAGLLSVIEAARVWKVRRLAFASSIGVYTGRPENPWTEDLSLPNVELPHLIVAFKKAAEVIAPHALIGSGVDPIALRIATVWGPMTDPESPFFPIPRLVSALLRGDQPPPLVAGESGDRCYAPDAGRAIALLMTAPTLRHRVYNVSNGTPSTDAEFAEALQRAFPESDLTAAPGGESTPHLDISRLVADTGFAPRYDTAAAVADYVAWRRSHIR